MTLKRDPWRVCCSVPQIYRSYIAQGQYDIVQDEIKDDAQTALQAVKLLATYKSKPDMKDIVLMTIKEWLADASTANNPVLQTVAGIIYLELGELEEAARVVHAGTTLEMVSLQVQIYLRMARVEVAQKSLALMSRMEDDATLTQLTGAWVNMALGGEKVQEAFYTFQVYFCLFLFLFTYIYLFFYLFTRSRSSRTSTTRPRCSSTAWLRVKCSLASLKTRKSTY